MPWLNRLPGHPRSPYGLECRILKRLPIALLGVTVVPLLLVLFTRWIPPTGPAEAVTKQLLLTEIWAWSFAITGWSIIFTLAIGCAIVWVMKGPGFVADAYALSDADLPSEDRKCDTTNLRA
jgi:hypothetical protein